EDDFEYLEVRNVGDTPLDLTDVRFVNGIHFNFTAGTQLAAGASTLVVKKSTAFNARYGAGKPIAGEWLLGDVLSNGGEQVRLTYGAEEPIADFTYDDNAPWPTQADGLGYSLVLV
ncbi:MAG: hypothetical protein V4710_01900, partial [Verrucomicrobiota bacterium]